MVISFARTDARSRLKFQAAPRGAQPELSARNRRFRVLSRFRALAPACRLQANRDMRNLACTVALALSLGACSDGPPGAGVPVGVPSGSQNGVPIYTVSAGDIAFDPGIDAGYFIVTNKQGGWTMQWTGDARLIGGAARQFNGVLTAGSMSNVMAQSFESGDVLTRPAPDQIAFVTTASSGWDGVTFGASGAVTFDLEVDGERRPDLVYFMQSGRLVTPATVPFILR